MNRKISRFTSWQTCFLLLAGLTFGSFGEVLCIGDDGHVEIESACQPCCGKTGESCQVSLSTSSHEHHDSCDNCSDYSLDGPTWHRKQSHASFNAYLVTSLPLLSLTNNSYNSFYDNDLATANHSQPYNIQVVASISTTVIIC